MALNGLSQTGEKKGLKLVKTLRSRIKPIEQEPEFIEQPLSHLKPLREIPTNSIRAKYASHVIPKAEIVEGQVVIRTNLNPGGTYQKFTNLKGKLIGLREVTPEGNCYSLIKNKDGKLIEKTITNNGYNRTVSDSNGKVTELSERTYCKGETILTQDANGNIVEKNL